MLLMRRQTIGRCHLCTTLGRLSFEHSPVRAAFNSQPLRLARIRELLGADLDVTTGQVRAAWGWGPYTLWGLQQEDWQVVRRRVR